MNNRTGFIVVALVLSVVATPANAQWTPLNGLEGGYVSAFLVHGSRVYAGTVSGGVYVSTDTGKSWSLSNNGMGNVIVNSLAVWGTTLLAGCDLNPYFTGGPFIPKGGVFRSTDEGASWTLVDEGIPAPVNCLLVTTTNSDTNVYAGTVGGGVYVSSNAGLSWLPDTAGSMNMYVSSLVMRDTVLFAGTTSGVYRSSVNGTRWSATALDQMHYSSVSGMLVHDTLLFASGISSFGSVIFRTGDDGAHWIQVNTAQASSEFGPIMSQGSTLLVGCTGGNVLRSSDHGSTWTPAGTIMNDISVFTLSSYGSTILAGLNGGGIFLSTDIGSTWASANKGLHNLRVNAVAVKDSSIFAIIERRGILRTSDNGNHWTKVDSGLTGWRQVGLAVSNSILFAGVAGGGVFKTTDNGDHWNQVGTTVWILGNTWSLAAIDTNLFAGIIGQGVYRSTDDGEHWTPMNQGLAPKDASALAASSTRLFAGTFHDGVFRTTDLGTNWTAINNGLGDLEIVALAVNGTNVFAQTLARGMYVSTNSGDSWSHADSSEEDYNIVSLAASQVNLYAGTSGSGIVVRAVSDLTEVTRSGNPVPAVFSLEQNYPNPFNPTTEIRFSISKSSIVDLKIFDLLGREVAVLVNSEQRSPGRYTVKWNGVSFASGVYFYRLRAGNFVATKKLVLLR